MFCYFVKAILMLSPKLRCYLHLITATSKICRNTFAYAATGRIYAFTLQILKLIVKCH
jgi:hypothetical protein